MEKFSGFRLKSLREVEAFEKLLLIYEEAEGVSRVRPPYLPLATAYRLHEGLQDGERSFACFLDLRLCFSSMNLDMRAACAAHNAQFGGRSEGWGELLGSQANFNAKIAVYHGYSNLVLRYRAFWDKLMGYAVSASIPDRYEFFVSSKTRLKTFKKILGKDQENRDSLAMEIVRLIEQFDNTFRTAEAHQAGVLRKHVFLMETPDKTLEIELLEFWNKSLRFVAVFSDDLRDMLRRKLEAPRDSLFQPTPSEGMF